MKYYGVITLPRNAHVCLHQVAAAVLRWKIRLHAGLRQDCVCMHKASVAVYRAGNFFQHTDAYL
jgi:hypothetical protein